MEDAAIRIIATAEKYEKPDLVNLGSGQEIKRAAKNDRVPLSVTFSMRVSIVTPSFNQGHFLEETIQSVLSQSHSDIEYMILDAASTDNSLEIIKRYQDRLALWQSKKDRGFADAINQGWSRATGEILCYLNSDDVLLPDAIQAVVEAFRADPEADVVHGRAQLIDERGGIIDDFATRAFDPKDVFTTWLDPIGQPSAFIRRRVYERFGGMDESLHFIIDFEYWIRIVGKAKFVEIPRYLSQMRVHKDSKNAKMQTIQAEELIRIATKFIDGPSFESFGISRQEALKGLYFRAARYFRNARSIRNAFLAYSQYCRLAFPPLKAWYHLSRFTAGMLCNRL